MRYFFSRAHALRLHAVVMAILMAPLAVSLGAPGSGFASEPMVATGRDFSVALSRDGEVYTWGGNGTNGLGDATVGYRTFPAKIAALSNVVAVSAKGGHALALDQNGVVWAWGLDRFGQAGGRVEVSKVETLPTIVAVSAGDSHSLALGADGTVWAWGGNNDGELGDGTFENRIEPVVVQGLPTAVAAIYAGCGFSAAVTADGGLWMWGYNRSGELGASGDQERTIPKQLTGIPAVVDVALGDEHSVMLDAGGALWSWGANGSGQLGMGVTSASEPPGIRDGVGLVAAAHGYDQTVVLRPDGTVWAWGKNDLGQAIGEASGVPVLDPTQVLGLPNIVAVDGGNQHTLALGADGSVWAWGANESGELGDGTVLTRTVPVRVVNTDGGGWLALGAVPSEADGGNGTGGLCFVGSL